MRAIGGFFLFGNMNDILYAHYYALTLICVARCRLLIKYASTSTLIILYVCFDFHVCTIVLGIHYFPY